MSLFEAEFEMPGQFNEWEMEGESYEADEYSGEMEMEMELAHELLEITSEAELEEFLGKLISSVGKAASGFIKSPIGKALGGVLKNVAKTALPMVGSALGSFVAPGIGTAIGGKLGSMAGNLLEDHEMETMGEAEAELEAARRYVQWARGATRYAMGSPSGANPRSMVRSAAVTSARRYAPALLRSGGRSSWRGRRRPGDSYYGGLTDGDRWAGAGSFDGDGQSAGEPAPGASGRWVRRGSQIILFDA